MKTTYELPTDPFLQGNIKRIQQIRDELVAIATKAQKSGRSDEDIREYVTDQVTALLCEMNDYYRRLASVNEVKPRDIL